MARTCMITKKGSLIAGGYSNRIRATKFNPTGTRRRKPNLQMKTIFVPEVNKSFRITVSTEGIKIINKKGAYRAFKEAGIIKA